MLCQAPLLLLAESRFQAFTLLSLQLAVVLQQPSKAFRQSQTGPASPSCPFP